jgi:hypothetical protein
VRRCLKMAAEEPQQQKQEPLGSDSEGTDQGRDVEPGLAGTRPGPLFPRSLGRQSCRRRSAPSEGGPFLLRRCLPSPSQWKKPPRPPSGRGGPKPAACPLTHARGGAGPEPLRPRPGTSAPDSGFGRPGPVARVLALGRGLGPRRAARLPQGSPRLEGVE